MNKYLWILLLLTGCATPETILQSKNGDHVTCGGGSAGSIAGGMLGYSIQKSNDDACVQNYMAQGYQPVKINGIQVSETR